MKKNDKDYNRNPNGSNQWETRSINEIQKIINTPREVSEILSIDLIACNNYKNGKEAVKKIKCPMLH